MPDSTAAAAAAAAVIILLQVKVKRRGSDKKFVASVLAVGTECDIGEYERGGGAEGRKKI
jgi:hypothetical protein